MFENLNVKTRRAVNRLCEGKTITLGGDSVGPISEESRKLLALLAVNLNTLQKLRASDLIEAVLRLYKDFKFEEFTEGAERDSDEGESIERKQFRIGKLRACSFCGLAPAGKIWKHDFGGESHLLYGPNGCGKSSLLGAICWCLTGRLIRDDCEPREPEKIRAYPVEGTNACQVDRDDAQALIDAEGNSSSDTEPYWVMMQLLGKNGNGNNEEVWLKRHSEEGISRSDDGNEWSAISNIEEIGIDEVDAELHLLMPAKISYLKFGKNPDLVHLLAEIVGYGNLETIADVAEILGQNARRIATNTENRELRPEEARIEEFVEEIKKLANDAIKRLPTYEKICEKTRTRNDVVEFGKAIGEGIGAGKKQLSTDLGIDLPEEGTEEYKDWKEKSNNLPGQVSNLLTELEKPLRELFPSSIGMETPSVEEINRIEENLNLFEQKSAREIEERLEWARKEAHLSTTRAAIKARIKDLKARGIKEGLPSSQRLEQWEKGPETPTYSQLEKIAKAYRRPVLTFFLPEPPSQVTRLQDFRTVGSKTIDSEAFNPEFSAFLRKLEALQISLRDLLETINTKPITFIGTINLESPYVEVAKMIRELLNYSFEDQRKARTPESVFSELRHRAEDIGIFVLLEGNLGSYHTNFPAEVFRGLSISDDITPFIVINPNDAKVAMIFSLIHELCHLLLGESGISN